jgi:sarcosine oxidase subunit alpha
VTRDGKTIPNLRATTERLENDIAVRSVNAAPTAAADRAARIDRLAPMLPAGFYYKTFLLPRWETFEGSIRAMAGLGRVDPNNRPPADNPQFNARCDLLVVGAGAAGLSADAAAARAGRVVFLLDDHADIGGQLAHRGGSIEGGDWRDWAQDVARAVEAAGGRVMTRTTAYGAYDGDLVCAWERRAPAPDALWRIRPQKIVIAAGAIERPLIVPRQRSARRDVRRRSARLSQALRRVGRQADCRRDQQRQRLSRCRGFGREGRGGGDCRYARHWTRVSTEHHARRRD